MIKYDWGILIDTFIAKNSQLNLSAIRDPEGVFLKHIQDSLKVNEVVNFTAGSKVIDVGTGGGFPIIPLAISNPEVKFIGIDSIGKKVKAVNEMVEELKIRNIEVIHGRIEEQKKKADFITARAVAYVDKLIDRSYNLLRPGGKRILMKKEDAQEKKLLLQICKKKSLNLIKEYRYKLFTGDIQRVIYVVERPATSSAIASNSSKASSSRTFLPVLISFMSFSIFLVNSV